MEREDVEGSVTAKPAQLGVWSVRDIEGVCYCRGGLVYGARGTPRGLLLPNLSSVPGLRIAEKAVYATPEVAGGPFSVFASATMLGKHSGTIFG
jgi:hypothetical protein